jgi:hypothetical protein
VVLLRRIEREFQENNLQRQNHYYDDDKKEGSVKNLEEAKELKVKGDRILKNSGSTRMKKLNR